MRSSVAVRLTKALILLCAALLCCSLIPTSALASQRSLSLIPEGEQGTVRIPSGAEGGALDTFSHCASYGSPSVDADGAVTASENADIEQDETGADTARVSEDVPLVSTARGYVEIDPAPSSGEEEPDAASDDEAAASFASRETFYAEDRAYQIVFDANGGSYAPEDSSDNKAAFGGPMPDISRYLVHVAGKAVYPTKDKYVFMGFYDGSDWTCATKYYNKDFGQDDTCQKTYPYPADGLTLYAGWAPVLSCTVPTSVSIAVGSVPELGAPTADAGAIANYSPWPVRCTTLSWDDTELPVTEEHLLATEAKAAGLLAQSVKMTAGTLDAMFSSKEGVYLEIATEDGATYAVQPGGTDVLGPDRAIDLPAAAADGSPSTLDVSYTISLAQGVRVTDTEKVSTTTLLTPFEAVVPEQAASSGVLFNPNGGVGGQSASLRATFGAEMPALTDRSAPTYEGRDFLGWFDSPDWTSGARYYDASGAAIDDEGSPVLWDKEAATVLYAGWRAKGCSVTFVAGPVGSAASMEYGAAVPSKTYSVPYGTSLGEIEGFGGVLPAPFWRSDYTFLGYYDEVGRQYGSDFVATDYTNPLVLTARWSGYPVTVTWNAQGGSVVAAWEGFPSGSVLGTRGALPEPERAGYAFCGWWSAPETGVRIGGDMLVSADVEYYARWTGKTITLSWNVDGAITTSTQTFGEGATVLFPASVANPTKEGYTFEGFFDTEGAKVTTQTKLPTDNSVFTARWKGKDITITWDSHGGSAVAATTQTIAPNAKLILPAAPTKQGYEFGGWYADEAYAVQVSASTDLPAHDVTYHAKWTGRDVTITWDPRDGTAVASTTQKCDESLALPTQPTRAGFTFAGWWTGETDGTQVSASAKVPTGDVTYYARWTGNTITLTWAKNDGSGGNHTTTTQTYAVGAKVTLPGSNPTRTGYTFAGWYTAAANGTQVTGSTALPTGNTTYHAHWAGNEIALTWNSNGGSAVSGTKQTFSDGAKVSLPSAPTYAGFTFAGWWTAASGGTQVTASTALPSSSATYYAHWTGNTITLTWAKNDGSGGNHTTTTQTYAVGAKVTLPGSNPTRTGYTFAGWYTAAANGTQVTGSTALPTGNTTYHAHWSAKTSALTFNANGGTGTMPTSKTATYGSTMPSISGVPTRAGYEFLGYYDATSGGTKYYNANLTSARNWDKDTTGGTTLYAQWQIAFSPTTTAPSGVDGDFYLLLDKDQAAKVSTSKLTVQQGYYGASQIKVAAKDIADKGTSSDFYEVFKKIMDNDYMFKTKWKDVTADNNTASQISNLTTEYNVRIIGLRQDYKDINADGSSKASYAGITFQFAEKCLSGYYRWNNAGVNTGGWEQSEIRARMNSSNAANATQSTMQAGADNARSSIWNRAPEGVTSNVRPVYKFTHNAVGNTNTAATATRDQLFLTSYYEMVSTNYYTGWLGNSSWLSTETVSGTHYQYWQSKNVSGNSNNASMVKQISRYTGASWAALYWWERTVQPGGTSGIVFVNDGGAPYGQNVANADVRGIPPCFCF